MRTSCVRASRTVVSAMSLAALTLALAAHTAPTSAAIRPARETARAPLWRKLYDQMPVPWKTDEQVVVREVTDKDMDRLVTERGDSPSHDGDDQVDGFFEFDDDHGVPPTIYLRQSLPLEDARFVFTHEYGHYVWEEKLTKDDRTDYVRIWNEQKKNKSLVSGYARASVEEGFAEAYAHLLRNPEKLHNRDPKSEAFLNDLLDRAKQAKDDSAS